MIMYEELVRRIGEIKKERNAVILAHNYQPPEIQDIGDFIGDSLALCKKAAEVDADVIVFCGVRFMAESAVLLNPGKTVLLPEAHAGCPMADMADAQSLRRLKKRHPDAVVVCYVNSSAEVKAESDICCTSSNAESIVSSIPEDRRIIFVPDRHLGGYIREKTGRPMILWPGYCPVHRKILPGHIAEMRKAFPEAKVLVHPECREEVVRLADFTGSTGGILTYVSQSNASSFIIGTETGIIHSLKKENPAKFFIPATSDAVCGDMKMISLEKILHSLQSMKPVVRIGDRTAEDALKPVSRMLDIG
ncbi:MAG: quinolinate synthase NadA [Spirochaetales bacterium]|nr:quinolinate synthase NadA [Spirochaetales bacterium]